MTETNKKMTPATTDPKGLITSKTGIGIIISFLGKAIAYFFGVEVPEEYQNDLITLISLGVSVVGDGIALYGRAVAKDKVEKVI